MPDARTLFDGVEPPTQRNVAPCPFCGAEGITAECDSDVPAGEALHWLECQACGACGPVCESAELANWEWNNRYAVEYTRFEVNRLMQELQEVNDKFDRFRIRVNSRYHDEQHKIPRQTSRKAQAK